MILWARRVWKIFQTTSAIEKVKNFYLVQCVVKFFIHEVKGQESHRINYGAMQKKKEQEERKIEHLCSIKGLDNVT